MNGYERSLKVCKSKALNCQGQLIEFPELPLPLQTLMLISHYQFCSTVKRRLQTCFFPLFPLPTYHKTEFVDDDN